MNDVVVGKRDDKPVWVRVGSVELNVEDHGLEAVEATELIIDMNTTGFAVTIAIETLDFAEVDADAQALFDASIDAGVEERAHENVVALLAANYVPEYLPGGNSRDALARLLIASIDMTRGGPVLTDTQGE